VGLCGGVAPTKTIVCGAVRQAKPIRVVVASGPAAGRRPCPDPVSRGREPRNGFSGFSRIRSTWCHSSDLEPLPCSGVASSLSSKARPTRTCSRTVAHRGSLTDCERKPRRLGGGRDEMSACFVSTRVSGASSGTRAGRRGAARRLRHDRAARVRARPLVAPPAPQPARAADQGRAAVQAEHRGHQRPLPSGEMRHLIAC